MKMRFWQKTYIFTLLLFLLLMNTGILSLTVYTYSKNVEATETAVKAEQYYVAMNFERDYEDLSFNTTVTSPTLLMQTYGTHYESKGILLAFKENGKTVYTNTDLPLNSKKDSLVHTEIADSRHIIISASVCGRYELIFAKDVSTLDTEFRSLMLTFVLTALAVSFVLAVCLYFILKKLSAPLDSLRKTTEAITAGDYTVTAEEKGNDEFTLLAASFNSMINKINGQMRDLEIQSEKKQNLVDNLAHELRTPLTSIHGYSEFIEKASTDEKKRITAAKYIMSESERLLKISDILLDSAYIRGNPPEMKETDVSTVLLDVAKKLMLKSDKAGVTIKQSLSPFTVIGNETLLSMLFYNLTENAIKACKAGDTVTLCCEGGQVSVADTGKGMTEEQLKHITEPFYRTDKSRSRAEGGAGLGLALCKQIAETHGAVLSFESAPDKGTRVTVTFTTSK